MSYELRHYLGFNHLPSAHQELWSVTASNSLFLTPQWIESMMSDIYGPGNELRLVCVEEAGEPVLLIPMRYTRLDGAAPKAQTFASVAHAENFAPLVHIWRADKTSDAARVLTFLFTTLRTKTPYFLPERVNVVRLCPFPADSKAMELYIAALKESGFWVQVYDNSISLYQNTEGVSYEDYFAARSSNHRYNCRRRQRYLDREGVWEWAVYDGDTPQQVLEDVIDEYILVAAHSWKPYHSNMSPIIINMIRMAASAGGLRLSVLRLEGKVLAVQFWVVAQGVAHLLRSNFRSEYADFAPGVVLTNLTIERLLDVDKVREIDCGFGADEYKGKWVDLSRVYKGIIAFDPRSVRGLVHGARQIGGRRLKRFLTRRSR